MAGAAGSENSFRFSTKRAIDAPGLVLYEYRPYSPLLGRWLSRDPLGGNSLYELVENNPLSNIDFLGLSALKEFVRVLADAGAKTMPSEMVRATRFPEAFAKLNGLTSKIKARYDKPGKGKSALYDANTDTITIEQYFNDPAVAVHEMTHAYQDIVLKYFFDKKSERLDEGEAYAVEHFYTMSKYLKLTEQKIWRAGCSPSEILSAWQGLWKKYGVMPGEWGNVLWAEGPEGGEPLTKQDLARALRVLGIRLSCAAQADVVNEILAQCHCCVSVKCTGATDSTSIGPGIEIDPFFE